MFLPLWRRLIAWLRGKPSGEEPAATPVEVKPLPPEPPAPLELPTTPPALLSEESLTRLITKDGTASPKDVSRAKRFLQGLKATAKRYNIDTPLRLAHFLAQILHESGGLRYVEEIWGPTPAQSRYEGRNSLGNLQPGDGHRFRGRGLVQLTGRTNYEAYGADRGIDFTENPDLVSTPQYATDVAGWFWDKKKLNRWADEDNVEMVTRRVNGGLNGFEDRKHYLRIAKDILGI